MYVCTSKRAACDGVFGLRVAAAGVGNSSNKRRCCAAGVCVRGVVCVCHLHAACRIAASKESGCRSTTPGYDARLRLYLRYCRRTKGVTCGWDLSTF
jgi:hypothetical protein